MARKILIVTAIRSEYDILYPVLRAAADDPRLDARLVVTGAHLSARYGLTVREIEKDGFAIAARVESLIDSDSWTARVKGMGLQLLSFVELFARERPEMVVVMGDREESMTASMAAAYCRIAVAHIGGGDNANDGNIDNSARHAATKFAHLHLATTERSARRIRQLGEEPWRVHVVGASGLDKFLAVPRLERAALLERLDLDWGAAPYVVVLLHPTLMDAAESGAIMTMTLEAVAAEGLRAAIIHPNSDPGNFAVIEAIDRFVAGNGRTAAAYRNLPREEFVNLMRHAHALVGNSSCGIIEAPSLGLPVVNIGIRQRGREHAANVEFVDPVAGHIRRAVAAATRDPARRAAARDCVNPYGDGRSGARIAALLAETVVDERLIGKKHLFAADGVAAAEILS